MKEVVIFSSPLKRVKNQMAFRFGGLVFLVLPMAIILTSGLPNQGSAVVNRPESKVKLRESLGKSVTGA